MVTIYLVVTGDVDDVVVFGVFTDLQGAERARKRCCRRFGGFEDWYRVEERELDRVWGVGDEL